MTTSTLLPRIAGGLFAVSLAHLGALTAAGALTPAVVAAYVAAGGTLVALRLRRS